MPLKILYRKIRDVGKKAIRSMKKKEAVHIPLLYSELLKGRSALVTGGTRGIGYAIAEAFLRSGAQVVITGRSEKAVSEAVCALNGSCPPPPTGAFGVVLDNACADKETFECKFAEAAGLCGGIDILVNNAGMISGGVFGSFEMEGFDRTLKVNLSAPALLSEIAAGYMVKRDIKGNILNICSSSSLRPAVSAYTLSKWGLRGLTLGMAKALIPYGIVVNGLAPGPTATGMLVHDGYDGLELETSPAGRYASADEIGNMAAVLVSSLGRMVVGDIVYMTGGAGVVTYDDTVYGISGGARLG